MSANDFNGGGVKVKISYGEFTVLSRPLTGKITIPRGPLPMQFAECIMHVGMLTDVIGLKEKEELVERVANSATFSKSRRLREFLLYVADCTIHEHPEGAREQQIAVNVFNRKPDYNPGQDNIVRVEARSLRKRLEIYFATEGKEEPLIISIPKGSYSVCFDARRSDTKTEETMPGAYSTVRTVAPESKRSRWMWGVTWAFIAALAGTIAAQWIPLKRPEKALHRLSPALMLPYSALIEPSKDTYIVTSDSSLVLIQDIRRQRVSLDDYITGRYMVDANTPADPARRDLIRTLLKRRYTNAAETAIAGRMIERNSWVSQRIYLRYGHGVQLTDFKHHNAILFGSPSGNPWVGLFSDRLNFQYDWDGSRRGLFRNRSPLPGEQAIYSMTTNSGDVGTAYAVVALVPNVDGDGNVLLVAGTTGEGTEAAGEFITDEARTSAALKAIGINPAGPLRYFEILLEARAIAGSASQSRVLSARLIPDAR
jgi:hypothetical protein